jgi:hypothetical protein
MNLAIFAEQCAATQDKVLLQQEGMFSKPVLTDCCSKQAMQTCD